MTDAMLPLPWVEKIFKKLTLVYGRDFMSRWEGQEVNDVIDDWAEELAGLKNWPESITYALQNLPSGKPPTVLEFRAICFRAPKPERQALPEPVADKARVETELAKLGRPVPKVNVYTDWIGRGLSRLEAGMKVSPSVEKIIREAAEAEGVRNA